MKTAKEFVDDFYKSFDVDNGPIDGIVYNEKMTEGMDARSYFEMLANDIIKEIKTEKL